MHAGRERTVGQPCGVEAHPQRTAGAARHSQRQWEGKAGEGGCDMSEMNGIVDSEAGAIMRAQEEEAKIKMRRRRWRWRWRVGGEFAWEGIAAAVRMQP